MENRTEGVRKLSEFPSEERSLSVVHSFVHSSETKVTSFTVSIPKKERYCITTFSDKTNLIRVKLGLDEIAGLADAVDNNRLWSCYHTFQKTGGEKTEVRMQYNNGFINAEKSGAKIALKLTEDERASLKLLMQNVYSRLLV